jgi:AraC family transcriptional regulator
MQHLIQKIINYIESNLDEELTLEHIAKQVGYSPFHFSRIFKAHTGEPVIAYITRLRLERSATHLGMQTCTLLEISQNAGYQTATGFLKAFKKRFRRTPTIYKNESKKHFSSFKSIALQTPKLIHREDTHIMYIRELGKYDFSSQKAWGKLISNFDDLENNLHLSELLGICYDDPEITKEEHIRYEAGITLNKKEAIVVEERGFKCKILVGGKYLKTIHRGQFLESDETYNAFYLWLKEHDYTLRDAPSIEVYMNISQEVDTSELLTYIYLPIL